MIEIVGEALDLSEKVTSRLRSIRMALISSKVKKQEKNPKGLRSTSSKINFSEYIF